MAVIPQEVTRRIDWSTLRVVPGSKQEGIEKGRQEGRQEGIAKGERAILVKQLALKFGTLDPETQAKIDAAPPPDLELWAERILTASTVDEVVALAELCDTRALGECERGCTTARAMRGRGPS
jgi:hypothetical protein